MWEPQTQPSQQPRTPPRASDTRCLPLPGTVTAQTWGGGFPEQLLWFIPTVKYEVLTRSQPTVCVGARDAGCHTDSGNARSPCRLRRELCEGDLWKAALEIRQEGWVAHGCWGRGVRLATKLLLLSVPEPQAPPGSDAPDPENHCGEEVLVASERVPIPATVWTGRLPGLGCARQGRG